MAAFAKSWRRESSKIGKSAFGGKAEKPLLMLSLTAFDALLPRDSEHFRIVPRTGTGFGGTVVMTPTGNVGRTHAARSSQSSIFRQPFGQRSRCVAARGARAASRARGADRAANGSGR